MIVTTPTKAQRAQDEQITGIKNIMLLRLHNISDNVKNNSIILMRYLALNCINGQEVFIDSNVILDTLIFSQKISIMLFTGDNNVNYRSLVIDRYICPSDRPLRSVLRYSPLSICMSCAYEGRRPFDRITTASFDDPDEVAYIKESASKYYDGRMIISMNVIKRCVRQRELISKKIFTTDVCTMLKQKAQSIERRNTRLQEYVNDLRLIKDARQAYEYSWMFLGNNISIVKHNIDCSWCGLGMVTVQFVDEKEREAHLQLDVFRQDAYDKCFQLERTTTHRGMRSMGLVVIVGGVFLNLDDIDLD